MDTVTFEIKDRTVIVMDGPDGHVFPLEAVASWGALLGITDTAQIVAAILSQGEGFREPDWGALYDKLGAALTPMSAAGVPAYIMPLLLDPEMGSPIPGPEILADLHATQNDGVELLARQDVRLSDSAIVSDIAAAIDNDHAGDLSELSVGVFDALSPTYMLPPS